MLTCCKCDMIDLCGFLLPQIIYVRKIKALVIIVSIYKMYINTIKKIKKYILL